MTGRGRVHDLVRAYSDLPASFADDAPESSSEPASSRASSSTLDPPRSTPDGLDGTDAPDRSPAPGGDSEFQTPKSKLVLVVDDNADVRRYVRSVLEPEYAVLEASGGEAGLRQAREALPDVILADGEPVTQVAYAVGYDTLSTFSRVFREQTGTSPSTYPEP